MNTCLLNFATKQRLSLICLSLIFIFNIVDIRADAPSYNKKELLSSLIKINDNNIPTLLNKQWTGKDDTYYGAIYDRDSVVSPQQTSNFIETLMSSYVSTSSKYYRSTEILNRMTRAAKGLLNLQHEDGTIDLLGTNFHSTPDLGFTIYPLAVAYSIMLKNSDLNYGAFQSTLKQYLLKAGDALTVGGVHTPNHRWAITGALAWINTFFPNPKYKARVEQWLAEKIDIDPDGQYNERSTAIYTPITNRSLIIMAKKMNYDDLYDDVRKNLDMTFYFVRSTGDIATESSNRQDKYKQNNLSGYYFAYNYMAMLDKNSKYAGMVKYIESTVPVEQLVYMLPYLIDDYTLMQDFALTAPIPTTYHKYFKYSDMVRIRKGEVDMSVIANNTTFFTFFKGEAALEAVRLSSAFFGKGQFQSQQLEKVGASYILTSTIYAPYFQPLPKQKIPSEGEAWGLVPRSERVESEIQTLRTKIYITEVNGKAKIKVSVEGPKNLPVNLEFGFRLGGTLTNVTSKQNTNNAFLITNGEYATYTKGKDNIKIGPGTAAHKWTQLRGALPKLDLDCLYFTNYAPCEFEFTIE